MGYDPLTCITAEELRDCGIPVPETVPDCAWVPDESIKTDVECGPGDREDDIKCVFTYTFLSPFRHLQITLTV